MILLIHSSAAAAAVAGEDDDCGRDSGVEIENAKNQNNYHKISIPALCVPSSNNPC